MEVAISEHIHQTESSCQVAREMTNTELMNCTLSAQKEACEDNRWFQTIKF